MSTPENQEVRNPAEIEPQTGNPAENKIPVLDQQEQNGLKPRAEKLYSAKDFNRAEMNKLDVKEIKNVSGDLLIISDLYSEHDKYKDGITLQLNEEMDLTDLFTPKEINSSRTLREALGLKDKEGNPLYIAVVSRVSTPEVRAEIPDVTKKKLVRDDVNIFDAPPNEYDKRYAEVEKKEKEYNESLRPQAKRGGARRGEDVE